MAAKKKTAKKPKPPKKSARKNSTPKKPVKRLKKLAKKKLAKKKTPAKSAPTKSAKTRSVRKNKTSDQKQTRTKNQGLGSVAFSRKGQSHSGEQSGDLQGLSRREAADSESVDELLEEGNAFEAEVVSGVEDADGADEHEVQTHEVPEDDVPGEYLDKE
jgi:hypothetical protein